MSVVTLAEIADQIRGVSYGKADVVERPTEGFLPVLRANNITDDGLNFDDLVYVRDGKVSPKQQVRSGDIVIAASSGSISVVGKAAQAEDDLGMGFGAFCKVVRPSHRVHARYIGHFFKTRDYRRKMSALAAGANINNLKNEHIDEIEIPLPTLDEQKRIAAILDQADELRRKRKRALDRLNQLGQAIFQEMFGENDNDCIPLSQYFEEIKMGPFGSLLHKSDYIVGGIPLINPTHIVGGEIAEDVSFSIPQTKAAELENYRLRSGDIIIGRRGEMGRCAVVSEQHEGFLCGTGSMFLRPSRGKADPAFLAELIRSKKIVERIEAVASGVTMMNLNSKSFDRVMVPRIALSQQSEYFLRIRNVESMKPGFVNAQVKADSLFSSLQHRAFRGEL